MKTRFPAQFFVRLAIGLALIGAMIAVPSLQGHAAAQTISTRLQVLHGGPDVGKVELYLNGEKVLDNFEYGSLSDWIDVDPGTVRVTITRDRAGFNYAIYDVVIPVPAGNDYYAVITDALVLGGVFDVEQAPEGASRIQVTHASVDTPAVNVVASTGDLDLATSLNYAQTSAAVDAPAGTYDLDFTLADTGESLLTASGITIEAGSSYEIVLIGTPGDTDKPLQAVVMGTDLTGSGATPVASPAG
jgi:hypothetical protein